MKIANGVVTVSLICPYCGAMLTYDVIDGEAYRVNIDSCECELDMDKTAALESDALFIAEPYIEEAR